MMSGPALWQSLRALPRRVMMRPRGRAAAAGVVALALAGLAAWQTLAPAPALTHGSLTVEIAAGQGPWQIGSELARAGAIRSRVAFVGLALLRGTARGLRAGEYEIAPGLATPGIVALLESGRVRLHPVVHPEGATLAELAGTLERMRLARAQDVVDAGTDRAVLARLGLEAPSVEGYLFPDTYLVPRGTRPEQLFALMVERLRARVGPEVIARARARGLDLHRLLTLASIVEREAVAPDELPLIAAVFANRLRLGMPLQADPTVRYALAPLRRGLVSADLRIDHPYNTYRHAGLPPGPIASPGLKAIAAAADPATTPHLYFVAAKEGRHHFSVTLDEHNRAVARYRRSLAAAVSKPRDR